VTEELNGFLLDESGKKKADSHAGRDVAKRLEGDLAYDPRSESWAEWLGCYWQRQNSEKPARRKIAELVEIGTEPQGYAHRYLNSIVEQIKVRDRLPFPELATDVVPFTNGLLSIDTGELIDATPKYSTDYVLPHKYDPDAECPTILEWLRESVDNDDDTVEVLRAVLSALVRGLPVHKFLVLIGPGGTSKGVFQRLTAELVGKGNMETSSLNSLENNRFELAKYHGKRLCSINEVGQWRGRDLPNLKAMTGGDSLALERKHQQQTGAFVFLGLVLLATN